MPQLDLATDNRQLHLASISPEKVSRCQLLPLTRSSIVTCAGNWMDAHRSRTASTGGTGQQLTCGLRDVRDYEAASGGDPTRLGSSSPFNVKVTSLKLGNFEPAEVEALYTQHTAETGQAFTPEAVARAIELIGCQRWLDPTYDDNLLYRRDLG